LAQVVASAGELGVEGGWFGVGHTSDALIDDFHYERAVPSGSQAIQRVHFASRDSPRMADLINYGLCH
jgi:hypothetical protein